MVVSSVLVKDDVDGEFDDSVWDFGFLVYDDLDFELESGWGVIDEQLFEVDGFDVKDVVSELWIGMFVWQDLDILYEFLVDDFFDEELVVFMVIMEVEEDMVCCSLVEQGSGQLLVGVNCFEVREVIVINVLVCFDDEFIGIVLKNLFEVCGLEFGDMDIYYCYEVVDIISLV